MKIFWEIQCKYKYNKVSSQISYFTTITLPNYSYIFTYLQFYIDSVKWNWMKLDQLLSESFSLDFQESRQLEQISCSILS